MKLNGNDVVEMPLSARRHRYRIPLPGEAQRQGENRLRFEFAESSSMAELNAGSGDGGRLAAAFYGIVVGAASDESLDDLLRPDAPWPFAVHTARGVPGFDQVGAGSVRFALKVPAGGRFLASAELHPGARAAGGEASVVVTVETQQGEREVYRRELSARGETSLEVDLPLRDLAGEVVRLGLHVEPGQDRFAWIRWTAPPPGRGRDRFGARLDGGRLAAKGSPGLERGARLHGRRARQQLRELRPHSADHAQLRPHRGRRGRLRASLHARRLHARDDVVGVGPRRIPIGITPRPLSTHAFRKGSSRSPSC